MEWKKISNWRELPTHTGKILIISSNTPLFGNRCRVLKYSGRSYFQDGSLASLSFNCLDDLGSYQFSDTEPKYWTWFYYMELDESPMVKD